MKVVAKTRESSIATVYIAENDNGRIIEFAQSLQPPYPRQKKWVFLLSTLYGCPVKCSFCDAWGNYYGRISFEEIFFQIDYLLKKYNADSFNCEKLKIQFARVGEPSYNYAVIDVLSELVFKIKKHVLYPSISTVAPSTQYDFFKKLITVKKKIYPTTFQLQFSIHSTNDKLRDKLIPIKKWSFREISNYASDFFEYNTRKITLNFIYNPDFEVDIDLIKRYFSPDKFLIKVTPLNPTYRAVSKNLVKEFIYDDNVWFEKLREDGYDVIVSIGELEENKIGSNCGQYITNYLKIGEKIKESYTYELVKVD